MPYPIDGIGRPIFLISNMAMHTKNIQADYRASLFVSQGATAIPSVPRGQRFVGDVLPISEDEAGEALQLYLSRYENSRPWADFKDFGFYHFQPLDIYYVGGFGSWDG